MLTILKKELLAFFGNSSGYVVIILFLTLNGLLLWVLPGQYNILDAGYANVDGLFQISPWLFLFLCPAITMRLIAEEKQNGTWELIITKPISKWSITIAKFLAAWLLVIISILPTVIYFFSVRQIAEPVGNIDTGAFWGSFIGLILLSAVYVSIGLYASSLSKNQIISFILAALTSFVLFYGFDLISNIISNTNFADIATKFGINYHYKSISRGVIASNDIGYFGLITVVFLILTLQKIKQK